MRKILLTISLMFGMCAASVYANYMATVGSGTTFLSFDSGGVKSPAATLANSSGTEVGTGAAPLRIDPTGSTTQPVSGTVTANQGGAPWSVSASGTFGVTQSTSPWVVSNGGTFATQVNGFTSWAGGTLGAMATYGTSPGAVNVPGVNAFVTNANANGQATMANSSPVVIASNQSAEALWGHGATGASVPANATMAGARAQNAEATAVTNGQLASLATDLVGKLINLPYANPENFVSGVTASVTDTTLTSVIASAGGSLRNYITSCKVTNSHATVGTYVNILDGASTVIDSGFAAPVGGGWASTYPVPLRGTAATAVNCKAETTGASFKCSCQGYKGI